MSNLAQDISRQYFRVNSIDPTRTITLRQRFVREFRRRFRLLMADVREAVVDLDVFGLTEEQQPKINASGLSTGAFDFPTNSRKIDEFTRWLDSKVDEYLLSGGVGGLRHTGGIVGGTDLERARQSWMTTYLDAGYQQGIRRARQELRKAGVDIDEGQMGGDPIQAAFNGPIHVDRVGLIYTRAYSSLKGITAEMDSAVSDVLAMGLAEGKHPRVLARMLDRTITGDGGSFEIVDSLKRKITSRRRAEILARTETIRAHHSANMGEYRAAGAMGITILAEHLTANDARVCPLCAPLQGKRYTVEEAENVIPVHPQCRCVAIPYIPDDDEPAPEVEPSRDDLPAGVSFYDKKDSEIERQLKNMPDGDRKAYIAGALKELNNPERNVIIYKDGSNLVSAASLYEIEDSLVIDVLGSVGSGGGTKMIEAASVLSKKAGKEGAITLTPTSDVRTISFYIKTGFDDKPGTGRQFFLAPEVAKQMRYINVMNAGPYIIPMGEFMELFKKVKAMTPAQRKQWEKDNPQFPEDDFPGFGQVENREHT